MHNALLDVSAKALQKSLEKEANIQNREDFSDFEPAAPLQVPASASIFQRLIHWIGSTKVRNPHVATPKLKNKSI